MVSGDLYSITDIDTELSPPLLALCCISSSPLLHLLSSSHSASLYFNVTFEPCLVGVCAHFPPTDGETVLCTLPPPGLLSPDLRQRSTAASLFPPSAMRVCLSPLNFPSSPSSLSLSLSPSLSLSLSLSLSCFPHSLLHRCSLSLPLTLSLTSVSLKHFNAFQIHLFDESYQLET